MKAHVTWSCAPTWFIRDKTLQAKAKAIGPDNIPNQALKLAADEIARVLQHIFQHSLDTGELPLDWRRANITPIYKKGQTTDPANYRPVSLTYKYFCKLLEHIIDSNLMKHLSKHGILSDHQHVFRKARSCETQPIPAESHENRHLCKFVLP